jgi:uncharacterized phage protein gp47/JayE
MYEETTYDVMLERMLDSISDKLDKREGSVIYDALSPAAIELQLLYIELDNILTEAYGDTASRDYLVLRCAERGITPYEATNAVLKGVFTPADIDVSGQRFNIGDVNYTVTEKIAAGEYKVECEDAGTVGNQYLGTVTPIEYIDGLETAELTEVLIPGEDEEDVEDLRERYFASFEEKAFGGNIHDYLEKTNAINGVGSTKVTRVWNSDIRPADMIPGEAVQEWYEKTAGSLDEDVKKWLSTIYTAAADKKLTTGGTVLLTILNSEYGPASDTLVETVQNTIDPDESAGEGYGIAPIGHVVTVKSANPVSVDVTADITFDTGYGWDGLQDSINQAVSDYLLSLRKEWADSEYLTVRVSQIDTRLLSIEGIIDIDGTKLNGQGGNLTLGEYDVPVLGGVSE